MILTLAKLVFTVALIAKFITKAGKLVCSKNDLVLKMFNSRVTCYMHLSELN